MAQTTADKKKNLCESVKSADTLVKDIIPEFVRLLGARHDILQQPPSVCYKPLVEVLLFLPGLHRAAGAAKAGSEALRAYSRSKAMSSIGIIHS
jgi:hypothetical protein